MLYKAKNGDSPSRIARAYGVSRDALLRANSHKPTTVVAGQRTWQSLRVNEPVNVPVGGMVGDLVTDALSTIIGSPCDQTNVRLVCAIQRALGVTVDGKWGNDSANAARARFPNAPPACSPRPSWWAPKGQSNCTTATARTAAPAPSSSSLDRAASAALAALVADSNYCVSVKRVGTPVNTAVHNFKAAWNAANPTNPVPIGTGNYEPIVQIALALALNVPQENVPTGCGAGVIAPAPTPPAPLPPPPPVPTPTPTVTVPAAVAALVTVNPCDQSSLNVVYAAQRALGVSPDGKYGNDTATAARRYLPNAPAGCSPRPAWWAPKGQSNTPSGPGQPIVVTPEAKKKLSTGAIVAGAIGAAALVGLIAVAATGKKTGRRGARGRRGPSRHRKSSHRKSSHKRRR